MGKKHKDLEPQKAFKSDYEAEKTTFPLWFYRQMKAGNLHFWQQNEISVFFKEHGLTDLEEADKYSELLKLY